MRAATTQIETYSGHYIDYMNPDPADIAIEDIANGLANTCRFAGQVTRYYSVAEHACYVASLVTPNCKLEALHHDSHEAYTGDITRPMKEVLEREAPGVIPAIEEALDKAICYALGLSRFMLKSSVVKWADDFALKREAATLKWSHGIGEHWSNETRYPPLAGIGWSPEKAERMFLEEHNRLVEASA